MSMLVAHLGVQDMFTFSSAPQMPENQASWHAGFMPGGFMPDPLLVFLASEPMAATFMFVREDTCQQPATSKAALHTLPEIRVAEKDLDQVATCCICLNSFRMGDKAMRVPCGHIYHPDCIKEWLGNSNQCAVCRYELATDDPEYEKLRKASQRTLRMRRSEVQRRSVAELHFLAAHLGVDTKKCLEKEELVDCIMSSGFLAEVPEGINEVKTSGFSEFRVVGKASKLDCAASEKEKEKEEEEEEEDEGSTRCHSQETVSALISKLIPQLSQHLEEPDKEQLLRANPKIADAASHSPRT
eukprot:TRINITY_DN5257_c0_g2_i1.p1 TRINITY_DN5257_c0_g2~~TRINITY_DN5257_c0_g2_i1.p1  ORF type:complete len:299 (-),score=66.30 TRINITY_DN5257_c0_g2_i1:235-1131(-)